MPRRRRIEPVLLTLHEVASLLHVSDATVRREIARGRLIAVRIGERNLRVAAVEVDRYLRDHDPPDDPPEPAA